MKTQPTGSTTPIADVFGSAVGSRFERLLPPGPRTAGDYVAALHSALRAEDGSFHPSHRKTDSTLVMGEFRAN